MTAKVKRSIKILKENVERYSPLVEKKLSRSGTRTVSPVIVRSAAKYYPALKKLADR